ncbi:glycosyltransferase family 2 protein [Mucilaginibacter glaciei]|uniref:Glycosyltransferase n=1 Tax=Mucilaginibacter glaciei TaxID=2772109 RepID=A0A926NWX0_9SPHI|nr:glycosyltransferase [Mucilaginibacter glaciei]MBD1393328.1 glycosyltransferase [Mucilaginibacter glaciei]
MAKVCVIMSVFNQQDFVYDAIKSMINQSFTDFDFIIINDGSTDGSENIIKSFSDNRIRYISNGTNKGLIYSLNYGIDIALASDCKYIARMDSDDISLPERLAQQVNYLDRHPDVGLLGGAMEFFGDGISPQKKYAPVSQKKIISTFFSYNALYHPTVMLSANLVETKRYSYDFPKYEDYGLWIALIGDCQIRNLPVVLVKYRRHNSNVTGSYQLDILKDQQISIKLLTALAQKLNIVLSEDELSLLSTITTANRARIFDKYTTNQLAEVIRSIIKKCGIVDLDLQYLKQLLIERAILYLVTNKRKGEIIKLIFSLNAYQYAYLIAKSLLTGRRY